MIIERHRKFHALHQQGCFVIPNPWDMGSAKMMAASGAVALATSSAALAFTLGRPDMGQVTREEALRHGEDIVRATSLPVSGDFENGFADAPDDVAETIRLAAQAGLSGCSIEDTQMIDGNPAYDFELAVDRIKAAADAARSLPQPFMLCARADGVMNGVYNLDEGIRRIQAFERAGAGLVYIPVPPGPEELKRVIASVKAPVNALAAGPLTRLSVKEIAAIGARRISLGSMIARVTHAAIAEQMDAIMKDGDFTKLSAAASGKKIDAMLVAGSNTENQNE
ncbi:isocitrate lyase/phosphoenolpyruvate mutase family protein [Rhizobium sp. TH2]|uniref:isocitrate lyase/PEP mutase family protein n=1 Tax=Rhizobium sp. TH2 TaxID=2775403 RepID=UPI002157FA72|nr:isocitrate lyase/phosphoenolpyruvate mutase family protein [Rhizobium sp. TH2]UVC07891.1 isocitrate lyase/phosphoenolpyruvate mutase family protein [Rhizobium sp. TH2]